MKTIYVVGGAGWLGLAVLRYMDQRLQDLNLGIEKQDYRLRALVQTPEEVALLKRTVPDIDVVIGDITDPQSCRSFFADKDGLLIHLAGVIHPKIFTRIFYEVNYMGTRNVLEAAHQAGVRKAVVMSSNSPIGCNPSSSELFDEDSPYNPYMKYGDSKKLMEEWVRSSCQVPWVLIRAPWFYGPNQPKRQVRFFEMIKNGKAPIVGGGNQLRSMAYVDNLAQGILKALFREDVSNDIFWLADKRPYSMAEVVNTVEYLLAEEFNIECKYKRLKLPSLASSTATLIDFSLQKIGLYNQEFHVLGEMNKIIACKVDKAMNLLDYQPDVELEEGMRNSIKELVERGDLK